MRYAVFFRNLNLGRRHCPDRTQFEQAFLAAGAAAAKSFLTNGTLAFDANNRRAAESILASACRDLHAACGLEEPGFLRSMETLSALVGSEPFASTDTGSVYGCYVTFVHPLAQPDDLPVASARGNVQRVAVTASEAFCIAHQFGKSPGSPNAFVEKALGLSATTRAWNTVVRLVAKYG